MNKKSAFHSFLWKFSERILSQIIAFIVSIILARLLTPFEYGQIAIVLIFITFANVFVSDGFSTALVQNKNSNINDFNSVFSINLVLSIFIYFLIYMLSPIISSLFDYIDLTLIIRVIAIKIPISSLFSIQSAFIQKKMEFRLFFFSTLLGSVISGFIGILMALANYGIWSLVVQYLINIFINTIVLHFVGGWKPKLNFKKNKNLKFLLLFGSKILFANIIITIYNEVRALIIGKIYSPTDLAFYNRGKQFPGLFESNINSTISSVLFPLMAKRSSINEIKLLTRRSITLGSFIIWPTMVLMNVLSEPIVIVLLTEKWLPAVPFFKVYTLIYALMPIQTANIQALKATGNGTIYTKVEVIKRIVGLIILISVMTISVEAIVFGTLFSAILFIFINSYPNKKIINYSYLEQLKDILPSIMYSIFMGICVYLSIYYIQDNIIKILMGIFVGISSYIVLALLFRDKNFGYFILTIKNFLGKT